MKLSYTLIVYKNTYLPVNIDCKLQLPKISKRILHERVMTEIRDDTIARLKTCIKYANARKRADTDFKYISLPADVVPFCSFTLIYIESL